MPSTPAATIPIRVSSPLETLKPANSMIASLGIGMQADSRVISRKTAASPAEPMNSVATSTIGSTTLSVMLASGEEGVHRAAHRRDQRADLPPSVRRP